MGKYLIKIKRGHKKTRTTTVQVPENALYDIYF
jgi:hypothetical protein